MANLGVYMYSRTFLPSVAYRCTNICTSHPLSTVACRRTPVLTAGRQRLHPGERELPFGETGCQSLLKDKLQLTYLQSNAK